jgi:hypothetical protein
MFKELYIMKIMIYIKDKFFKIIVRDRVHYNKPMELYIKDNGIKIISMGGVL